MDELPSWAYSISFVSVNQSPNIFPWTTSPCHDAIGETHLLYGGAKIDVRITYRSGLHLEIFIKTKQDVSGIVVNNQTSST